MTETTPQPAPKSRPWGKIVLFVSLALNLAVAGLVAGAFLRGGPNGHENGTVLRDLGFGPFVYALPRHDKVAMGEALKREAGSFRENRAELRRQFEAFLDALRADPFDAAEVERLIADQRLRVGERQQLGQRLLLERIEAMSAAQRAEYANALDNMLRRRKDRR